MVWVFDLPKIMAGWKLLKAALFVVLRPALRSKKTIILSDACRGEIKETLMQPAWRSGWRVDRPSVCRVCFMYPSGRRGLEEGFGDDETHKNFLPVAFTADEMDISFYLPFFSDFAWNARGRSGELLSVSESSPGRGIFLLFNVEIPRDARLISSAAAALSLASCVSARDLWRQLQWRGHCFGVCRHLKEDTG